MTKAEWIAMAEANADKLRALIEAYHPGSGGRRQALEQPLEITAPGAEAACEIVRRQISEATTADPLARFSKALGEGDVRTMATLLNDAWFGVPESTDCWRIEGFKEAVDLLDDMPEVGEEEGRALDVGEGR